MQPSPPFAILIGMRWVLLGVAGLCGCSSAAGSAPGAETDVDAGHVADAGGAHDAAVAPADGAPAADAGEALDAGLEAAIVDPQFGTKCQGPQGACVAPLDCCGGFTSTGIDPTYDGGVEMHGLCSKICFSDADCTGASDPRGVFPPGTRCVLTNDGTGHQGTGACVPPTKPTN